MEGTGKVPNYRRFLQNAFNKTALAQFVYNYVMEKGPEVLSEGQSVVLAGGLPDGKKELVTQKSGVAEDIQL